MVYSDPVTVVREMASKKKEYLNYSHLQLLQQNSVNLLPKTNTSK